MPLVKIEMWEGRDEAKREELIRNVSRTVVDTLKCPVEMVWVIIDEVPKSNWGMAGVPATKIR